MSRPDRVENLAEVHPDDAALYTPDPDGNGFVLNSALAARADILTAEVEAAKLARAEVMIDGALHLLLAGAGVEALLIRGGVALFRQTHRLRLVGDVVQDERGVPMSALFEAWSTSAGRQFLARASGDRKPAKAPPGPFATAVRGLRGPH